MRNDYGVRPKGDQIWDETTRAPGAKRLGGGGKYDGHPMIILSLRLGQLKTCK